MRYANHFASHGQLAWLTCLTAVAIAAGGCGGDDGSADSSPPPPDGMVDADASGDAGDPRRHGTVDPECEPLLEAVLAKADIHGTIGGGFGYMADGELVCTVDWGSVTVTGDAPVTSETIFGWGRMSRQISRLTVLELAAAGALDLDATVESLVGEIGLGPAVWASAITVRQLLLGNSGLPKPPRPLFPDCTDAGPDEETYLATHEDGNRILRARPGLVSDFQSRVQEVLIALVIEAAGAADYPEVVDEMLFTPLGMESSWAAWNDELEARGVVGHTSGSPSATNIVERTNQPCDAARAFFGTYTSLADAVRLMTVIARGGLDESGARLLAESTVHALTMDGAQSHRNGGNTATAGLTAYAGGPAPLFSNVGRFTGFSSGVTISPEARFGVIELSNTDAWQTQHPAAEAAVALHGWGWPNPEYGPPPPEWNPTPEELAEYAGTYVDPLDCEHEGYTLTVDDRRLVAPGLTLTPNDPDTFRTGGSIAAARVVFWRDDAGEIAAVSVPGRSAVYFPEDAVPDELMALRSCP